MRNIKITDKTFSCLTGELSFREKTEIAKQLDKLGADVIELPAIKSEKADVLLIKNIASVVEKSALSVTAGFTKESLEAAFSCIKEAKRPVINVALPVSPAQMEYMCALKPDKMLIRIEELISLAKALSADVCFTALDATRAEKEFLYKAIECAVKSGASSVTLSEDAGVTDAEEYGEFVSEVFAACPCLEGVEVYADVCDSINMSTASVAAALKNGAAGIKTAVTDGQYAGICDVAAYLNVKGEKLGVKCGINTVKLQNVCEKINEITDMKNQKHTPYGFNSHSDENISLHKDDDYQTVAAAVRKTGYDLSPEDMSGVFEEFGRLAEAKEIIGTKELEAIIASVAIQVPSTYRLVSYVINSGNVISATANLCIEKDGKELRGVYVGDGPIDAAFLAIEQVVGHHFDLDDFRLQSVTEGREAMGQALVKLRSDSGKLYSGSGISTDVIGASIKAYLNALNKIAFEENR